MICKGFCLFSRDIYATSFWVREAKGATLSIPDAAASALAIRFLLATNLLPELSTKFT